MIIKLPKSIVDTDYYSCILIRRFDNSDCCEIVGCHKESERIDVLVDSVYIWDATKMLEQIFDGIIRDEKTIIIK